MIFFSLAHPVFALQALELLKLSIQELYSKKGPEVVKANQKAVDAAEKALRPVPVPEPGPRPQVCMGWRPKC